MNLLTEITRRLDNMIRLGTIAEIDHGDPAQQKMPCCRIRTGAITTGWLPWINLRSGSTRTWNPPTLNEQCMVFSPSGDPAQGIVLLGLNSTANPAPSNSPAKDLTTYPDDAVIEYDHVAHFFLPSWLSGFGFQWMGVTMPPSSTTGITCAEGMHSNIPADAVPISDEFYLNVIAEPASGMVRSHDAQGLPILIQAPHPTTQNLCDSIDSSADVARLTVIGDPQRATIVAQAFKDAGYPAASIPRTASAWTINGRNSTLAKSAAYTEALHCLRETRLSGKEQVCAAMVASDSALANDIAASTVTALESMIKNAGDNSI